jgi:hypothetical protein
VNQNSADLGRFFEVSGPHPLFRVTLHRQKDKMHGGRHRQNPACTRAWRVGEPVRTSPAQDKGGRENNEPFRIRATHLSRQLQDWVIHLGFETNREAVNPSAVWYRQPALQPDRARR